MKSDRNFLLQSANLNSTIKDPGSIFKRGWGLKTGSHGMMNFASFAAVMHHDVVLEVIQSFNLFPFI